MAVEVFRMIADTTRLRLLWHLLVDQELSVNELAHAVHKSSSGVSQHLAKQRTARVVFADPRQKILHRVESAHARQLVEDGSFTPGTPAAVCRYTTGPRRVQRTQRHTAPQPNLTD